MYALTSPLFLRVRDFRSDVMHANASMVVALVLVCALMPTDNVPEVVSAVTCVVGRAVDALTTWYVNTSCSYRASLSRNKRVIFMDQMPCWYSGVVCIAEGIALVIWPMASYLLSETLSCAYLSVLGCYACLFGLYARAHHKATGSCCRCFCERQCPALYKSEEAEFLSGTETVQRDLLHSRELPSEECYRRVLHDACRQGDFEVIRTLVRDCAITVDYKAVAFACVGCPGTALADWLGSHGKSWDWSEADGMCQLVAESGKLDRLLWILDRSGLDKFMRGRNKYTECVEFYLKRVFIQSDADDVDTQRAVFAHATFARRPWDISDTIRVRLRHHLNRREWGALLKIGKTWGGVIGRDVWTTLCVDVTNHIVEFAIRRQWDALRVALSHPGIARLFLDRRLNKYHGRFNSDPLRSVMSFIMTHDHVNMLDFVCRHVWKPRYFRVWQVRDDAFITNAAESRCSRYLIDHNHADACVSYKTRSSPAFQEFCRKRRAWTRRVRVLFWARAVLHARSIVS